MSSEVMINRTLSYRELAGSEIAVIPIFDANFVTKTFRACQLGADDFFSGVRHPVPPSPSYVPGLDTRGHGSNENGTYAPKTVVEKKPRWRRLGGESLPRSSVWLGLEPALLKNINRRRVVCYRHELARHETFRRGPGKNPKRFDRPANV